MCDSMEESVTFAFALNWSNLACLSFARHFADLLFVCQGLRLLKSATASCSAVFSIIEHNIIVSIVTSPSPSYAFLIFASTRSQLSVLACEDQ